MDTEGTAFAAVAETTSFLHYFSGLPDHRQASKVDYPLPEVLLLILLAVLAGAEAFTDIARFGERKNQEQHLRQRIIHFPGLTIIRQPAEIVKETRPSPRPLQMLSPRYPSSSSTCNSVEDNKFSTSAFCHEPFHPITLAASARGIDVTLLKVAVFVASASIAALSGSLYVHNVQFVAPDTFGLNYSLTVVIMLVVGGMGRIWGGVLGVVLLGWMPELLREAATWQPVTRIDPRDHYAVCTERPRRLRPQALLPRAPRCDSRYAGACPVENVFSPSRTLKRPLAVYRRSRV